MAWWILSTAGCLLIILEILIPSDFFLLFFGVSGLVTGFIAKFGIIEKPEYQVLFVAFLAILLLLIYKRYFRKMIVPLTNVMSRKVSLVDEEVIVLSLLKPGDTGRCEARGTTWNVENIGEVEIALGEKVKVIRTDGITLQVKK